MWSFGYDSAGNRTSLSEPNGTSTAYSYLTNNWLSSITHQAPGGAAFQTISYSYDPNGNRISQVDSSGTTTFSYNALNRLTQGIYPGTYGTWSWAYDAVGNRTSQTAPSGQTLYTYDSNNRLTQAAAVVYTYDANGNLTGTSAGQSFTYDAFNRMTQASSTGGLATYAYNGAGLKVKRIGPDGTTRYYYDGIRPIWETDGIGNMTAELDRDIFGNLLSRLDTSGARRYYHTDGLGSTIVLTDATGNFVAGMLYDAWGNVRASSADVGKYRFTGAELDTASGLYHMGARFYDTSIGRWLSEDPLQRSSYTYGADNPLVVTDPTGMTFEGAGGGCDVACMNDQRNAYAATHDVADYRVWLGASQILGNPPVGGWEQYMPAIRAAATKYGVEAALILAIMSVESGGKFHFDPLAKGSSGEVGLMQIMPEIAEKYGFTLSDRENPTLNIEMGARLLSELLKAGHGNVTYAISAYNHYQTWSQYQRNGPLNMRDYVIPVLEYLNWARGTSCGGLCP